MAWEVEQLMDNATIPATLLVIYFCSCMLSIANYVGYVRFNEDVYGRNITNLYLAFTVLGTIDYAVFSAVMWTWAAKYCSTHKERLYKIGYGFMGIFICHDLPLLCIEWHMILCCGWRNPFQGFVFVEQICCFFLSFLFGWLAYAYIGARFLQTYWGEEVSLKTGSEPLAVLPAVHVSPSPIQRRSNTPVRSTSLHRQLMPSEYDGGVEEFDIQPPLPRRSNSRSLSRGQTVIPMGEGGGGAREYDAPQLSTIGGRETERVRWDPRSRGFDPARDRNFRNPDEQYIDDVFGRRGGGGGGRLPPVAAGREPVGGYRPTTSGGAYRYQPQRHPNGVYVERGTLL